ncbi:GNAT family N-acetyltransferase [Roseateles sp. L2-2]|uniref:GNAT family N-acetyltransferase n=1 Tax=Roseateles sp. L2-2 TaxID=3422597 RepID=UPI003D36F609
MTASTISANAASPFSFVRGDEVAPEILHATFTAAFADYLIGPFQIPFAQWPMFLARQGVDLPLSRVALDASGAPLAFAFVAQRPVSNRWRLATMGAVPAARGTGAAPALLDDFIARAAAAGLRAVELEVFAQNERARRLYEGRGFRRQHDLFGFVAEPGTIAPSTGGSLHAIDMPHLLGWLEAAEHRIPDLPLQVTAATIRHGVDYHGWQRDGGQIVFSLPDETVMVHSFIALDEQTARTLIQTLAAVYPERRLRVPQLQRDDLGGATLRALGAVPLPLHQQLMLRPL